MFIVRQHRIGLLALVGLVAELLVSCATPASRDVPLLPEISQEAAKLPRAVTSEAFPGFFESMRERALIPGLLEGAVPQGLAFDRDKNEILISAYFDASTPSAVLVVERGSGRLVKTVWLATERGAPLYGHVGGIAVGPRTAWVASDEGVYRYALDRFRGASNGSLLRADGYRSTGVVASFCTYYQGMLWVGEFAYYGPDGSAYRTVNGHHFVTPDGSQHHALLAAYRVDPADGAIRGPGPERLISIPDRVQGAAFSGAHIYLSLSYGRRNKSTLLVFANPLSSPAAGELSFGKRGELPLWFLDRAEAQREITAPPMMEGITVVDARLLVLFESGAEKYRYSGLWSVDHLFESTFPVGAQR